jgi:hypothetical protein
LAAWASVALLVGTLAGCDEPALHRLMEARRLVAEMLVQFARTTNAGNRAVTAESDERSVAFAREAEQASDAVQRSADALAPLLEGLRFQEESSLLAEFQAAFARFRELDRTVLALAVENTNDEAQGLAFGAALEAADAFRDALAPVTPRDAAALPEWQAKALAASALASAREIQVLVGPHIAESEDASMEVLEQRMSAAETATRDALTTLGNVVRPAVRPQVEAATAAFTRLMEINAQIVALSRRNTDVRSMALSQNEKGVLTAECERALHALQDALDRRALAGSR